MVRPIPKMQLWSQCHANTTQSAHMSVFSVAENANLVVMLPAVMLNSRSECEVSCNTQKFDWTVCDHKRFILSIIISNTLESRLKVFRALSLRLREKPYTFQRIMEIFGAGTPRLNQYDACHRWYSGTGTGMSAVASLQYILPLVRIYGPGRSADLTNASRCIVWFPGQGVPLWARLGEKPRARLWVTGRHCTADCTGQILPPTTLNIYHVTTQVHMLTKLTTHAHYGRIPLLLCFTGNPPCSALPDKQLDLR